jgi:hypothetical protein
MSRFDDRKFASIASFVIIAVIVLASIGFNVYMETRHDTVYDKVIKAEREVTKDGRSAEYRIHCANETYVMKDSFVNGRMNSADYFTYIVQGHTYEFDVVGFRWDWNSNFRNIIHFKDLDNGFSM